MEISDLDPGRLQTLRTLRDALDSANSSRAEKGGKKRYIVLNNNEFTTTTRTKFWSKLSLTELGSATSKAVENFFRERTDPDSPLNEEEKKILDDLETHLQTLQGKIQSKIESRSSSRLASFFLGNAGFKKAFNEIDEALTTMKERRPEEPARVTNQPTAPSSLNARRYIKEALKNYDCDQEGFLHTKDGQRTGLRRDTLEKVVKHAFKHLNSKDASPEGSKLQLERRAISVIRDEGKVHIALHLNKLGAGGFGTAYRVLDIGSGRMEVFKEAHRTETAVADLQNEHAIGKHIWKGEKKPILGVVRPPRLIRALTSAAGETRTGFFTRRYAGDYFDKLAGRREELENLSSDRERETRTIRKQQFMEAYQLLSGLKTLAEKNVLHGDIKTENIFFEDDEKGKKLPVVAIADLGGARVFTGQFKDIPSSFTPEYTSLDDARKRKSLENRNGPDDAQAAFELAKKMDVFSMGCVLFEMFSPSGHRPFGGRSEKGLERFPDVNLPRSMKGIPDEIQPLIKEMLHRDPGKRPTAEEAFQRLDSLLQKNRPNLYADMQSKIAAYHASV